MFICLELTDLGSSLGSLERKSRFEVHHSHATQPLATPAPSASSTGMSSPVLSGTLVMARDSSQSRIQGEAVLSRDSSATRVSRFNVEASLPSHDPQLNSTAAATAGALATSQSKRSRFQVSSVDGKPADIATGKIPNEDFDWTMLALCLVC